MAIPGFRVLNVHLPTALLTAVHEAKGRSTLDEYVAMSLAHSLARSAEPPLASSTSTGPSLVSANACGTDNPPGYIAPAPRQRAADQALAEAAARDDGEGDA